MVVRDTRHVASFEQTKVVLRRTNIRMLWSPFVVGDGGSFRPRTALGKSLEALAEMLPLDRAGLSTFAGLGLRVLGRQGEVAKSQVTSFLSHVGKVDSIVVDLWVLVTQHVDLPPCRRYVSELRERFVKVWNGCGMLF